VDYTVADDIVAPPSVATFMSGRMLHLPGSFFPASHRALYPISKPLFGLDPSLDRSRPQLGLPYRTLPSQSAGATGADALSNADDARPAAAATSDAAFVFACFNKHLKIRAELFACWCAVLRRLPNAKLWLLQYPKESEAQLRQVRSFSAYIRGPTHPLCRRPRGNRSSLRGQKSKLCVFFLFFSQAAFSHGVAAGQLVFGAFVPTAEANWLRLWRGADAVLDTTVKAWPHL
jgi:hypothetical protein